MITTTTMGELLKRVYDPAMVEEMQNLEVPVLQYIAEGQDKRVGGDGLYFAVDMTGDEGFGYITEEGAIPPPQNEEVKQAKVTPTVLVGAVRVTGLGRAISSQNVMAFAQGLQFHMDKKLRRMIAYKEGTLFRNGTGKLLQFAGIPADTSAATSMDEGVFSWVRPNMLVDVYGATPANLKTSSQRIVDVDVVNQTVTFENDFSASVADNDGIYLAGTQPNTGAAFIEREPLGLTAAVNNSGTYLTLSRSSFPEWQGNVVNASSTLIDEDRLLQAEQRCYIVGGVGMGRVRDFRIVCHPFQLRQYFRLIIPRKEFSGMDFDAGWSKLGWNGHEFVISHNCQETVMWMGDFSAWQKFTAPDGSLQIDTTFGAPIKWAPGFDGGIAYWREYLNYAIRKPNAWVQIQALANIASAAR